MAVLVKCNPSSFSAGLSITVEVKAYNGTRPEVGELAYVWNSHTKGGKCLELVAHVSVVNRRGKIIKMESVASNRTLIKPLTYDMLRPYRDIESGVEASLAQKIVKYAHNKVASLSQEEAEFLDKHFSPA